MSTGQGLNVMWPRDRRASGDVTQARCTSRMNVHLVLHLHNISGNILPRAHHIYCGQTRLNGPMTMQKAVALAHLRVAYEPGDDEDNVLVSIPAQQADGPRLLAVPSAWWDTPAMISRTLSPLPEEVRSARKFARELLTCWQLAELSDDAEMIIGELVANAVRHGMRVTPLRNAAALRLCMLRRIGEVMLAVVDPSNEAPKPRQPDWVGESGRGLQIVGALSAVWGWSPIDGRGKAVWAVLRNP